MVQPRADTLQTYAMTVRREDAARAVAEARGHQITLNVQKGSGAAGFNAAETLLAALGACLLTNVNSLSQKMHLQIDDARMEITGLRRDDPPGLIQIDYRLFLDSPEPPEKLEELHALCVKWGTVTNTLSDGLTPQGEVVVNRTTAI